MGHPGRKIILVPPFKPSYNNSNYNRHVTVWREFPWGREAEIYVVGLCCSWINRKKCSS